MSHKVVVLIMASRDKRPSLDRTAPTRLMEDRADHLVVTQQQVVVEAATTAAETLHHQP
jgi:hypothetical protein